MAKYSANLAAAKGAADPVVEIGLLLGASQKRDDDLQAADYEHKDSEAFEKAYMHEQDRSSYLAGLLSTVKATSLEGAAMQIARALACVDIIRDQYPEEYIDFQVKRDFRELDRLLFSALDAVDAIADTKLASVSETQFGIIWTNPWHDPSAEVERRAKLRAEREAEMAQKGGDA